MRPELQRKESWQLSAHVQVIIGAFLQQAQAPGTLGLRSTAIATAAATTAASRGVTAAPRMGVGGVTVASIPSAPSFNPTAVSKPGTTAVAPPPAVSRNDATGQGEQQAGDC